MGSKWLLSQSGLRQTRVFRQFFQQCVGGLLHFRSQHFLSFFKFSIIVNRASANYLYVSTTYHAHGPTHEQAPHTHSRTRARTPTFYVCAHAFFILRISSLCSLFLLRLSRWLAGWLAHITYQFLFLGSPPSHAANSSSPSCWLFSCPPTHLLPSLPPG